MGQEAWSEPSTEWWEAAIRKGFWVTMVGCLLFALAAWLLAGGILGG